MPLSIGLSLQAALLILANVILVPTIVMRAAGETDSYLAWAVWTSVIICGLATALQAVKIGRIGAGYFHVLGGSPTFIAIGVTAVVTGGPELLATLVVISSIVPFIVSTRLVLLRKILTPTVSGTITMLIPVTVMPYVIDMLSDAPDGMPAFVAPVCFLVTAGSIVSLALKASGRIRTWSLVLGIVAGTVVAALFGFYDYERMTQASWIGFPEVAWRGFNLDFDASFWGIFPAFIFLTLIESFKTISNSIAVQNVSWRQRRAVDFRAVQGSIMVFGLGNFLSGIAGTVPTSIQPTSVAVVETSGVGSRQLGIITGVIFIVLACFPKFIAAILAIPQPVVAGYLAVLMIMIFMVGIKTIGQDGITHRNGIIVGSAFWVGIGFQNSLIFPGFFSEFLGGMLQNGIVAGGFCAIFMTIIADMTVKRPSRINVPFTPTSLPQIREFFSEFSLRHGWESWMADRLTAASEETLLTFYQPHVPADNAVQRQLILAARRDGNVAILEFIISTFEDNIQDQIAMLHEHVSEEFIEQEVSLRLLKHIASSVRHQQFHHTDVVTVRVEAKQSFSARFT